MHNFYLVGMLRKDGQNLNFAKMCNRVNSYREKLFNTYKNEVTEDIM